MSDVFLGLLVRRPDEWRHAGVWRVLPADQGDNLLVPEGLLRAEHR